jgi:hypothetical protein
MRQITSKSLLFFAALALASAGLIFTGHAFAQQKTVEQRQTGPTEMTVDTRNTTVAYVEGNHLVVRLADGTLEAMQIPAEERFEIDGESLALSQLTPGMLLTTQTITTTRPIVVKTVEVADGTVHFVSGRRLVIRTKDGQMADYTIPKWAEVKINGEGGIPLSELKPGRQITATFITEEPMTVGELEVRSHGHYPLTEPKKSEAEAPVATVAEETPATVQTAESEPATETPETLPETASQLPLIGLLGFLALTASFGLRAFRKAL